MTDETTNLATEAAVPLDDLLLLSRVSPLAPEAGKPTRSVRETGRLVRSGRSVILTLVTATPYDGDVRTAIAADVEAAEVHFANEREALRRDGWEVRSPEPWETPDPLAVDAPAPF